MATKTHIAWSIAAITTIVAMGLGGALYRVQETNKKQIEVIKHLRTEQAKIGKLSEKNSTRLASDVATLEHELSDAQNAQRDLTEQLFTAQEEITYLTDTLEMAEQEMTEAPEPTVVASPYPAYLALKRTILAGEPYHAKWEALQQQTILDAKTKAVLAEHTSGVASLDILKQQLRETYAGAHEVKNENPILSRLGDVISIRKLDKENDAIRDIVAGDVDKAAEALRNDSAYRDWIEAYDARQDVLNALDAIEVRLAGPHG